jgi:hypothetical protein
MAKEKAIDTIKVSDAELSQDATLYKAFEEFEVAHSAFGPVFKQLRETTAALEPLLKPVLPDEFLAQGKHLKLKPAEGGGLVIEVYVNEAKRGKKKAEIRTVRLNIPRPMQGSSKLKAVP